jgi:hypothetical protein
MSGSGIRIEDMPDLGAVNDSCSVVGEHAGSGRFMATSLRSYILSGGTVADLTVSNLTVTGTAGINGDTGIHGDLTVDGPIAGNGVFANTPTDTFGLVPNVSGSHIFQWSAAVFESYDTSTNVLSWVMPSPTGVAMQLTPDGQLLMRGGSGIGSFDGLWLQLDGTNATSATGTNTASLLINGGSRPSDAFEFWSGGSEKWAFRLDGAAFKIGGGPWADISDARIKTNVTDYTAGLAEIVQLRPVSYNFLPATNRDPDQIHHGLIAQEVEGIMPEMVNVAPGQVGDMQYDDMRSLDTQALIFALCNAVRTLDARIVALEAASR